MRPLAFTAFAVFTAASLAAAPLYAQEWGQHGGGHQQRHGAMGGNGQGQNHGNGQWQNRGGGERHHGGGGGGGVGYAAPALILGLGAAAVGAAIANGPRDEECGHYERVYDDWGNYRGRRWVDEC